MTDMSADRTRASLLQNAAHGDEVAWVKLDNLYRPLLMNWARARQIGENDAEEAVSEVLVSLVSVLKRFPYDPSRSFRGYLSTMLRNEILRVLKGRLNTNTDSQLRDFVADEASQQSLIDVLVSEEEKLKIPAVLLIVRGEFRKETTWLSWEMTYLQKIPTEEVAKTLGISDGQVYVNRGRVLKRIIKVGQELNGESPNDEKQKQ